MCVQKIALSNLFFFGHQLKRRKGCTLPRLHIKRTRTHSRSTRSSREKNNNLASRDVLLSVIALVLFLKKRQRSFLLFFFPCVFCAPQILDATRPGSVRKKKGHFERTRAKTAPRTRRRPRGTTVKRVRFASCRSEEDRKYFFRVCFDLGFRESKTRSVVGWLGTFFSSPRDETGRCKGRLR